MSCASTTGRLPSRDAKVGNQVVLSHRTHSEEIRRDSSKSFPAHDIFSDLLCELLQMKIFKLGISLGGNCLFCPYKTPIQLYYPDPDIAYPTARPWVYQRQPFTMAGFSVPMIEWEACLKIRSNYLFLMPSPGRFHDIHDKRSQ
jgi:hypothetical protein